jgi:dTDP-4-dehydrorhamnose reductase
MKRILICGSNGLLGQRLALLLSTNTEYEVLNTSHHRAFVFDHQLFDYTQLDITRKSDVKSLVGSFQPDVIINAAAATNVDWCETHRDEAWKANVVGVENLVEAARKYSVHLIHISTDYVFDGKSGPYCEEDQPNPISYYGKTKLAAENTVRASDMPWTVVRTIVVYGSGIAVKKNFALWVVNSLKQGQVIRCVDDQISNPTYVGDLAMALIRIFERKKTGLFHVCGSERLSRYEFAVRAAEIFNLDPTLIIRTKSADLHQPAPRPLISGFITTKAEIELEMKFMNATDGLTALKHELHTTGKN